MSKRQSCHGRHQDTISPHEEPRTQRGMRGTASLTRLYPRGGYSKYGGRGGGEYRSLRFHLSKPYSGLPCSKCV
eukprot:749042-Hanusia_phi.AAC.4